MKEQFSFRVDADLLKLVRLQSVQYNLSVSRMLEIYIVLGMLFYDDSPDQAKKVIAEYDQVFKQIDLEFKPAAK